jgi:oligopeptide transport system substrate-binding protein
MKKTFNSIFLFIALLSFSCISDSDHRQNYFFFNMNQGVETLEPVMSNSIQTIWALSIMMEGLVQFDKENNIKPTIAKNWDISEDGLIYTFHLRNDVRFHDNVCFEESNGEGRFVTAGDFKYCLERVNNPKTKTRGLWVFRDKIKGAQEYIDYHSGNRQDSVSEISGIRALNDTTLQIELANPFAPFLSILTMSYAYVYPKEAVEFYGENFAQNPVGTGPFMFIRWEPDKELIFEKNLNYWDRDEGNGILPYLNGIHISFTQSSETEFLDFQNGKYDFHIPSTETYDQLTDENGDLIGEDRLNYTLVKQPWLQTVFFGMMQSPNLPGGRTGPFANNKKLRQALNYAIDRERILKFVLKNRGTAAHNGPIPQGMPGFNPDIKGYEYNKEETRRLLTEAGFPEGRGLDLTLYTGNDEIQKTIAIAVQEQLKEFGINLKLDQMLQATLISRQEEGEFPFWRASWGADYFDPENFMALFYSKNITPNGPNRVGYSNPKIDELYERSIRITDFEERKKIYDEMQEIVIEDAAWLFMYYNQQVYLLQKNIEGFYIDGLNIINLKYARKR